jgi:hypothetical protein
MTRPTLNQLYHAMRRAALILPLDSFWQHQASGDVYQITSHHIRETDGVASVEYRPAGDFDPLFPLRFSRPVDEFFEQVFLGPQQTGIDEAPPLGQRFVEVSQKMEWARV